MGTSARWAALYGLLLAAFTIYLLLDTFVITRVYAAAPPAASQAAEGDESVSASEALPGEETADSLPQEPVITETSYQDDSLSITLTQYREADTTIYVADVVLSSPGSLRTALAQDSYGRNLTETTSQMAQRAGAILAINGDYYGSREEGYVLRNGVLYRSTDSDREALVIGEDGTFQIVEEGEASAEALLEEGAAQIFSFGPALVVDGEVAVSPDEEVGRAMASNPRTAIAQVGELHYLLVVSDGRTEDSQGLSLYELASFLEGLGAQTAYNLDGGGSSTLYFNGRVVNNPTTNGRTITERKVSDIVYIAP